MTRTFLFTALFCAATGLNAQQQSGSTLRGNTLGEVAAIANDLTKPMTLELEIPVHGPVKDMAPLVAYLRAEGFDLVAEVTPPPGSAGDIKSLAFKARKHGVLAKEAIDKWAKEVRPLMPEGLTENWNMRQVRAGS